MTDKLFHLLTKPALWQRSGEAFWDDEHISKGMLEAHLNPDWDAASRKHSFIDTSVKWLSSVIPAGSKVLDLGCGPGLYAKRLTDIGYDMTGMDYSKRSIAYAKSQDSKTEYIYQNYLEMDYAGIFDAVILIYCDYTALTPDERKTLVNKVYAVLKPGGLFILDVFTDKFFSKKTNKTSWTLCENGGFWSAEPHICLEATYLYEKNTVAVDQYIVITNGGVKEYLTWNTAYSAEKLTDELLPFKIKAMYGDVGGSPYTGEGETLCAVLEKTEVQILSLRDHPERADECRKLLLEHFNEFASKHPAEVLASAEPFPQGYFMLKNDSDGTSHVIGWTGLHKQEVVSGKVYGWEESTQWGSPPLSWPPADCVPRFAWVGSGCEDVSFADPLPAPEIPNGISDSIKRDEIMSEELSPWITPLLVHPDERGNRYGKMLMEHARRDAARLGFKVVYLTTGEIGYYEKYGFREVGLTTFTWGRPTKVYEVEVISERGNE